MMSNAGERRALTDAIRHLWSLGGFRAYYRGLSVRQHLTSLNNYQCWNSHCLSVQIGLVGVFP